MSVAICDPSTKLKEFRSTAYGANQVIPPRGVIHMLVAGFSCKDFSPLNRNRRNIDGALVKAEKKKKDVRGVFLVKTLTI